METKQHKNTGKDDVVKAASYLNERFKRLSVQFNNDFLLDVCKIDTQLTDTIDDLTKRSFSEFERNLQDKEKPDPSSYFTQTGYVIQAGKSKNRKLISKVKGDFFFHSRRRLLDFKETRLTAQKELLQDGANWLFEEINKIIEDSPEYITVYYEIDDLASKPGDSLILKAFKFRKRTWSNMTGKPISIRIPFRELLNYHLPNRIQLAVYNLFKIVGRQGFQHISGIQARYKHMIRSFKNIEEKLIRGDFSHQFLAAEREKALNIDKKKKTEVSFETAGNEVTEATNDNGSKRNEALEQDPGAPDSYRDGSDDLELNDLSNGQIPAALKVIVSQSLTKMIQLINEDLSRVDINGLLSRRKSLSTNTGEKLRKKIREIPGLWYKNQTLFINAALMELMLISAQNQLGAIVHKVVRGISETFDNNVVSNLESENKNLEEFAEEVKANPFAEFKTSAIDWGYARDTIYYKEMNEKLAADIREVISIFPDDIEIMGEARPRAGIKSLNNFENKQFDKIDTISVSLSRLINYLVQTNLSEPMRKQLVSLPGKFEKSIGTVEDVIRLISFSLNSTDRGIAISGKISSDSPAESETLSSAENKDSDDLEKSIINFINEGSARIKKELGKTRELKKRVLNELSVSLKATEEKLEPELIIESSGNLKEYIKKTRRRGSILEKLKSIKPGVRGRIAKIWYRKSESFLSARKLSLSTGRLGVSAALWQVDEPEGQMRMDEFLNILESVTPEARVIDALPFYYRQLFMGKQNVDRAFWTGRQHALADAERAVKWFRLGLTRKDIFGSGGLLIAGEQNSGKTYLSQYIAGKFFDKKMIYQINPPDVGSINIADFEEAVQKALNPGQETIETESEVKTLEALKAQTVFIINDLELWWERSKDGLVVIKHILRMINKYSNKYFFLVNINIYSYRYINKFVPLEKVFLKILDCEPFNAEELKDIILFRHKSTGLKYKLKNHREDDISVWRQAQLFSKYFTYSKGNVGVALQAWVSNIEVVNVVEKSGDITFRKDSGRIIIKEPKTPDLSRLKYMDPDWLLIILQFILHKRLSVEKIARISAVSSHDLKRHLRDMIRVGVIVKTQKARPVRAVEVENTAESSEPIFELNSFLRPHLVNEMVERNIL